MRALVKQSAAPGMTLREVPRPAYGLTDALIRVRHAGVCGTDLHIWEWDSWAAGRLRPPVVVGHEFAGEIVELGSEAAAAGLLSVGDLVTAEGHIVCGHCLQCRTGSAHLCQRTQVIGVDRDGAFAEFVTVPAHSVFRLPDSMSFMAGAYMEPVAASMAVLNADIHPRQKGLIYGDNRISRLTERVLLAKGFADVTV
ncbi:MAG: alcohol dehydrogenase catalytic domain-containing protein, partial [Pseudomonadota bacterium]